MAEQKGTLLSLNSPNYVMRQLSIVMNLRPLQKSPKCFYTTEGGR